MPSKWMNKTPLLFFLVLAQSRLYAADHYWNLKQSKLTYHVSHPSHDAEGVSRTARGMGVCHDGQCDFLIAVPVKTFESGNGKGDINLIQVTRGAQFPMVTVRTRLPESSATSSEVKADLEIQFAGQTVHYTQVPFEIKKQGKERRITGTIPATLADFKIDPPVLLASPVKNEIPIRVEMTWTPQ